MTSMIRPSYAEGRCFLKGLESFSIPIFALMYYAVDRYFMSSLSASASVAPSVKIATVAFPVESDGKTIQVFL